MWLLRVMEHVRMNEMWMGGPCPDEWNSCRRRETGKSRGREAIVRVSRDRLSFLECSVLLAKFPAMAPSIPPSPPFYTRPFSTPHTLNSCFVTFEVENRRSVVPGAWDCDAPALCRGADVKEFIAEQEIRNLWTQSHRWKITSLSWFPFLLTPEIVDRTELSFQNLCFSGVLGV